MSRFFELLVALLLCARGAALLFACGVLPVLLIAFPTAATTALILRLLLAALVSIPAASFARIPRHARAIDRLQWVWFSAGIALQKKLRALLSGKAPRLVHKWSWHILEFRNPVLGVFSCGIIILRLFPDVEPVDTAAR